MIEERWKEEKESGERGDKKDRLSSVTLKQLIGGLLDSRVSQHKGTEVMVVGYS